MPPYEPTSETHLLKSCPKTINDVIDPKKDAFENLRKGKNPTLQSIEDYFGFVTPLIWVNIIFLTIHNILGSILLFPVFAYGSWKLLLFTMITGTMAGFGVTGGAHRFWCHRSYKANLPLRIILMMCFTLAGQNSLFEWVRDHRVHHRFSETDGDPHNVKRGFFFAHIGWLMMKKHPMVLEKGRQVDMSDVLDDPVVKFHQKYFQIMRIGISLLIPTLIPIYFWDEPWKLALAATLARSVTTLNATWLVNSLAHTHGGKPYDTRIRPVENKIVSFFALGEGWHNYHHSFPWDYKTAELGDYSLNVTTMFIDIFAKIGWAYDLRAPSKATVEKLMMNYGDGSLKREITVNE